MESKLSYGIIGLLLGVVLTWAITTSAVNNQNQGMMRMMGIRNSSGSIGMMDNHDEHHDGENQFMSDSMRSMMSGLQGRTGDDFDKAFLSGMIEHHEGAIRMAEAALKDAKHQEIKDMARAIIDAQTKEINQMKEWQKQWYNQ